MVDFYSTHTLNAMTCDSFYAVQINFGDRVRNLQYNDERTARIVATQAQAQYGYDAVKLAIVRY